MIAMANLNQSIKKLISAINQKGCKLLYAQKQFMGKEGKVHPLYSVSQAVWDEDKGKYRNIELYSTTSNIRMTLYLRDYLFRLENKPLPTDNEMWNQIRRGIESNG